MTLLVQKYGGSSVATPGRLRAVAERIVATRRAGHELVVVVSAMGGSTDELLTLAGQVSSDPDRRELDLLLSAGEQVSSSLLAMALQDRGCEARALTGRQVGIRTCTTHGDAEIEEVDAERVQRELKRGRVVVVAGYQGITESGEVTTLGRGGSDTTAVALASALDADRCQILSDVDGVYSADPRVVPGAHRLDSISHDEMRELARYGAQVLSEEAVSLAQASGVVIEAGASLDEGEGTRVAPEAPAGDGRPARVRGVAARDGLAWVRGREPDPAGGQAAELARALEPLEQLHFDPGTAERPLESVVALDEVGGAEQLRELIGPELRAPLELATDFGAVTAVGSGLGRSAEHRSATRLLLEEHGFRPRSEHARKHALSWLLPSAELTGALSLLHENLVASGADASARVAS